jgi:superoxide dismutase, Fe-Mn family
MKILVDYSVFEINESFLFESESNSFTRPRLNYSYSSLEPHIDADTMEEHYSVHYRNYTKNLNEAIQEEKISVGDGTIEEKIVEVLRGKMSDKLRNNGGGFLNHLIYFASLSPDSKAPSGEIKKAIDENFGSFSEFKKKFTETALSLFGSGWVWLIQQPNGKLEIITTPNQDNPFMKKGFKGNILLGLDVWEHAYYLKHKANRKSYIGDFLKVVDWEYVENRMKKS